MKTRRPSRCSGLSAAKQSPHRIRAVPVGRGGADEIAQTGRGKDGVIRSMHNVCPHRGNKMLWEDDPFQEVQGRAPLLYCRFHGWRYKLDGSLHSATREDLLLDFDAEACRVPAIQCEVWEGFIFVNLNPDNTETVRDYLGELAHGIEGYDFAGPHQVYRFNAELQCNWKIFSTASPRATAVRIYMRHPSAL